MTVYEYRTLRISRASWPQLRRATHGPVDQATRNAGGTMVGLFLGMIGFASDEGVLIRAWPDVTELSARADATMAAADTIVESRVETLSATVRPTSAASLSIDGIYAHRWFWLKDSDWAEFEALSSDSIWPYFESDGCEIIGLWRAASDQPLVGALLLTRYPSVAHWERTRLQGDAPPGADVDLYRRAQEAARRRAAITDRSIVRLTRLVLA
jgi:hypothetical protein